MFVRPSRQATARSPHDARQTIVHRNELNEQQRPGVLVLFPQSFQETRGAKAATRWIPKLIRTLSDEGDGTDASAILADGLLFYTGAYIRQNFLDKYSLIPEALLCKDVLFITNHVDVSPVRGHSSSMAGTPVRAGAIPGIRPRAHAQTANTLRLVLPPLITPCCPALAGHLLHVRTGADLGAGLLDDEYAGADEQDETFMFGGYIEFNFKGKQGKVNSHPAAAASRTAAAAAAAPLAAFALAALALAPSPSPPSPSSALPSRQPCGGGGCCSLCCCCCCCACCCRCCSCCCCCCSCCCCSCSCCCSCCCCCCPCCCCPCCCCSCCC